MQQVREACKRTFLDYTDVYLKQKTTHNLELPGSEWRTLLTAKDSFVNPHLILLWFLGFFAIFYHSMPGCLTQTSFPEGPFSASIFLQLYCWITLIIDTNLQTTAANSKESWSMKEINVFWLLIWYKDGKNFSFQNKGRENLDILLILFNFIKLLLSSCLPKALADETLQLYTNKTWTVSHQIM